MSFQVWSAHEEGEVLEVTRVARATALDDVSLISDLFGRRAWVKEV